MTADLLRSLQDLFRRHPLPWRLSAFTYYDMNDRAVSLDVCADLLAAFGFDIVSLVEQCAEYGLPEDIKADADEEVAAAEKELDGMADRADVFRDERDDAVSDLRSAESQIVGLKKTIEDLHNVVEAFRAEVESLERRLDD